MTVSDMGSLDDIAMLDEIVKICEAWRNSPRIGRAVYAMDKIDKLVKTRAELNLTSGRVPL